MLVAEFEIPEVFCIRPNACTHLLLWIALGLDPEDFVLAEESTAPGSPCPVTPAEPCVGRACVVSHAISIGIARGI